jgi:hypothetical protein
VSKADLPTALSTLFGELVDGVTGPEAYMTNTGDVGLLKSLDKVTARRASARTSAGSSIASHVDHLRYGLSLMNRWSRGENPFDDADWSASWNRPRVTDEEWERLRHDLGDEAHRWLAVLKQPRDVTQSEMNSVIGTIAHLAYHLGAIRQIDQSTRGPQA